MDCFCRKIAMGKKVREIAIPIRDKIIQLWPGGGKGGLSVRKIATNLILSKTTVHSVIQKFKKTGSVKNLAGRGREPILTPHEEQKVVRQVEENPFPERAETFGFR